MKIKLIAERVDGSGYTVGKAYNVFDESDSRYFLLDDDECLRFIGKSLRGLYLDWEIVE